MLRLAADDLEPLVASLYRGFGAERTDAENIAESLVDADLCGHRSHGVRLVPDYAARIENGLIDPTAQPEVARRDRSRALVDGNSAFGRVTGRLAVDVGVSRARKSGIAVVSARHGAHLGRIGEWAERATDEGFACVGFVSNPASNLVAPPGSSDGRLSTNPVVVGIPSFGALDFPVILDMATSQVAYGKTLAYAAEDAQLPEEWTGQYPGYPDATSFLDNGGALRPLGGASAGYKGFGLASVGELLAGIFAQTPVSGQPDITWGNAAVFVFLDPLWLTTERDVEETLRAFERHVKSAEDDPETGLGPGSSGEALLLPGEAEHRNRVQNREDGVPVAEADARALRDLALTLGRGDALPAALADQ